jgi:hypothetical protein
MPRRILLISIAVVIAFSCIRIGALERHKAELKRDRVELSHIKYGLFNVDEWKRIIAEIITKKIKEFKVTKESRPAMKRQVEDVLTKVLDEVEKVIKREGEHRGIMGWIRSSAMDLFDVMSDVRKGIPQYADMLLDYLEDPKNKKALQENLIKRFNEMADKTVGQVDYTEYKALLAKYAVPDKEMCLTNIAYQTSRVNQEEILFSVLLALSCIGLAALILVGKNYGVLEMGTMVAGAVLLLLTGLSLPMIDIEATISSFAFKLVGEPVEFKDQVLFFQSKSILQVVWLLLKNGGFGLVIVALLVFVFSVLFPLAKLIASIITIARNTRPTHWLHRFLVFKSGKWSMADVMVVAIFMSYIGFNGVINSQLTQITAFSSNVQVFTTNNSVLQAGFYLFASYCLTGLLLSAMIEKRLAATKGA